MIAIEECKYGKTSRPGLGVDKKNAEVAHHSGKFYDSRVILLKGSTEHGMERVF